MTSPLSDGTDVWPRTSPGSSGAEKIKKKQDLMFPSISYMKLLIGHLTYIISETKEDVLIAKMNNNTGD